MNVIADALLFVVPWLHVLNSPYTKVEESFNIHAIHDVLMYGVSPTALAQYDHFIFSGAVPRTFIGSVLLSWLSYPVLLLGQSLNLVTSKLDIQICVRLVLATLNSIALSMIRRSTSKRYGSLTGVLFALISCSQFHIPYYIGRTLPNMFAMIPVNISTSLIIKSTPSPASRRRNLEIALSLLIFSAVVFRAELAALAGLYALEFLVSKRVSLMGLVRLGVVMTLASVALTVMVDSYFWQQFPLWPELKSIHFNIYEGKSSDWGVSPFYTYFATDIPKLFMASLPLLILGAAVDPFSQWMLLSSLGFVTVLSCIGHKEWRFIVYVVPLGNVIAAKGATWLFKQRQRGTLGLICILTVFSALCVNALVTALMTSASAWNYPGGTALSELHKLFPDVPKANIYIDNLAAQTGASMFLQENSPPFGDLEPGSKSWTYVKTENLKNFEGFSHVISEDRHSPGLQEWVVVKGIDAFGGGMGLGDITKGRMPSVKLETKLWIMERKT